MHSSLRTALDALLAGRSLTRPEMEAAMTTLMRGEASEVEAAALLTALAVRGETADEIAGAAAVMRQHATRIPTSRNGLLDTCGTGGDRLHTFNISTAAALLAAACGVPVAKHGNRAASSNSGSADVLEALGVRVDLSPEQVGRCIDEIGIGFCFARLLHTAMRHVAPVRTALGFRTLFNLLGPLANPAGAEFQLIGASRCATAEKLAGAIQQLGTARTIVVCGNNELDEVALWGVTRAYIVTPSGIQQAEWTAATFGLGECNPADLKVDGPAASAALIADVLSGRRRDAAAEIVLANTAAALLAVGAVAAPRDGVRQAREAIESGRAMATLDALQLRTQG